MVLQPALLPPNPPLQRRTTSKHERPDYFISPRGERHSVSPCVLEKNVSIYPISPVLVAGSPDLNPRDDTFLP